LFRIVTVPKIPATRTENRLMSGKRVSIAQVMMVVALAGLNLAVVRATPVEIVTFPTLWVAMGILDFLVIWKLILRRSLGAFHYSFLFILMITFIILANLVASEYLHPLRPLDRWYQQFSEKPRNMRSIAGLMNICEFWAVACLSVELAGVAGSAAAWLERRRGWDIAAFWRGALGGFFAAGLLVTVDDAACGWKPLETFSVRWIARMVAVGVGLILGGLIGLSKLKSRRPHP
jgi:hypothetical protein